MKLDRELDETMESVLESSYKPTRGEPSLNYNYYLYSSFYSAWQLADYAAWRSSLDSRLTSTQKLDIIKEVLNAARQRA